MRLPAKRPPGHWPLLHNKRRTRWDQPISKSLLYASLLSLILSFDIDIRTSKEYHSIFLGTRKDILHRWVRRDGLISALFAISSPRTNARAWYAHLCCDEPISLSQRCRMHIFTDSRKERRTSWTLYAMLNHNIIILKMKRYDLWVHGIFD